jgi:hypothetical protein
MWREKVQVSRDGGEYLKEMVAQEVDIGGCHWEVGEIEWVSWLS